MFFVLNKSKIYSYLIALSTVLVLFVVASKINDIAYKTNQVVETSTNIVNINEIQNEIKDITKNSILSE